MNITGIILGNMQPVHVKDNFIGQPQVCKYPADEGVMTDAAPVATLTTSHWRWQERFSLPNRLIEPKGGTMFLSLAHAFKNCDTQRAEVKIFVQLVWFLNGGQEWN